MICLNQRDSADYKGTQIHRDNKTNKKNSKKLILCVQTCVDQDGFLQTCLPQWIMSNMSLSLSFWKLFFPVYEKANATLKDARRMVRKSFLCDHSVLVIKNDVCYSWQTRLTHSWLQMNYCYVLLMLIVFRRCRRGKRTECCFNNSALPTWAELLLLKIIIIIIKNLKSSDFPDWLLQRVPHCI